MTKKELLDEINETGEQFERNLRESGVDQLTRQKVVEEGFRRLKDTLYKIVDKGWRDDDKATHS